MIKFRQNNQHFRTIDFVGLLMVFGIVTSAFGALLAGVFDDARPSRARASAEALALQIQNQREMTQASPADFSRQPASEHETLLTSGSIGRDPWGQPYLFKVIHQAGSETPQVLVWSLGPNHKSDSSSVVEQLAAGRLTGRFHFSGDDIGFVSTRP